MVLAHSSLVALEECPSIEDHAVRVTEALLCVVSGKLRLSFLAPGVVVVQGLHGFSQFGIAGLFGPGLYHVLDTAFFAISPFVRLAHKIEESVNRFGVPVAII